MTDAYTWILSQIRTEFRELIGLSDTASMADVVCNKKINDYYVNYFPLDAKIQHFDGDFTQATTAVDDGEYSLDEAYTKLMAPMFINNGEIQFFQDYASFREKYPILETYITAPTLVIGTTSAKAVRNSVFSYRIAGNSYSKAAGETAFSGLDTVPQNKYGAFSLKIDADGTITIAEADDNSDGYDSPALAIKGLAAADSDSCFMGFVTVISTAAFIPGTTLLSASEVTDTYTDGDPAHRGIPEGAYVGKGKLFLGPKPDDIFQFKCSAEMTRPTAFTGDSDAPADTKNGRMIAMGAASIYLAVHDPDRLRDLVSLGIYVTDSIKDKKRIQMRGRTPEPNF